MLAGWSVGPAAHSMSSDACWAGEGVLAIEGFRGAQGFRGARGILAAEGLFGVDGLFGVGGLFNVDRFLVGVPELRRGLSVWAILRRGVLRLAMLSGMCGR